MPLVSILKELQRARAGGYAVPLFDCFDHQSAEGILQALESSQAPGIIALYTGVFEQPHASALAAYLVTRTRQLSVPVSLMLDHGASLEHCVLALQAGCTDLMYDGSRLSIEENIANTRAIVRIGHAAGAAVEAEIGHVGSGKDYQVISGQRLGYTDPDSVEYFTRQSGVDFLAVAIGNAHGVYHGEPQLDLDLLQEIARRVTIPLVLHGGTGIPPEQLRAAIAAGITKINVATDLYNTAAQQMRLAAQQAKGGYFDITGAAVSAIRQRCREYIEFFGADGKAK